MPAPHKKSFESIGFWGSLSITLFGLMSLFLGFYFFNPFVTANSSAGIRSQDKVTVDGVENTTQYLTSLVLYPKGGSKGGGIRLSYDSGTQALLISAPVNADALVVGNNTNKGSHSLIVGDGSHSISDTVVNGVIIGGAGNKQNNAHNSVVIGGDGNNLLKTDGVAVFSSKNTTFPKSRDGANKNLVVIGGDGNKVQGSHSFSLGGGNTVSSESFLFGKGIKADDQNKVFVWSDSNSFSPKKSSAFYVNTEAGFGLNTNDPAVKFDFGNAGGIKLAKDKDSILGGDAGIAISADGTCTSKYRGIIAYVEKGDVSGFCGCDGERWTPLSSDPEYQGLCNATNKKQCLGKSENAIVSKELALPRWDGAARGGKGDWVYPTWTYKGVRNPVTGEYDCSYTCETGYHPGVDYPEYWQTGGCDACTKIDNQYGWRSAGTGNDNCDFSCKASFKYKNILKERTCTDCEVGKYTEDDNQDMDCFDCHKPRQIYIDVKPTAEHPHFSGFITKGDSVGGCNFECNPRYFHYFKGKSVPGPLLKVSLSSNNQFKFDGNACVYCPIGTYSPGGQTQNCLSCNNLPDKKDYRYNNIKYSFQLAGYSSNADRQNGCDRACKPQTYTEKKNGLCICPEDMHLEPGYYGAYCVSDSYREDCKNEPNPDEGVEKSRYDKYTVEWRGSWDRGSWYDPETSWAYSDSPSGLSDCEWTCKEGYKKNGNGCVAKQAGSCNDEFHDKTFDDLTQGDNLCGDGGTLDSFTSKGDTEYEKHWIWKCKGDAGTADAACWAHKTDPDAGKGVCGSLASVQSGATITKDTDGLCSKGSVEDFRAGSNRWTWKCKDQKSSDTCSVSCKDGLTLHNGACAKLPDPVNGKCDNYEISQEGGKATEGRCKAGAPLDFKVGLNSWTWTCEGSNGGSDAINCSAICGKGLVFKEGKCEKPVQPVDGECQAAVVNTPGNTMQGPGTCKAGNSSGFAVGLNGWTWICKGLEGGKDVTCNGTCRSGLAFRNNGGSGICLEKTKIKVCGGTKPNNNSYKLGNDEYEQTLGDGTQYTPDKNWKYTSSSNPGACEYTCANGYVWNGTNSCIKETIDSKCGGSKPTGAGYSFGAGEYTQTWNATTKKYEPQKSWKRVDSSNPGACEYTCANNYVWNGTSCEKKESYSRKCIETKACVTTATKTINKVGQQDLDNYCRTLTSSSECEKPRYCVNIAPAGGESCLEMKGGYFCRLNTEFPGRNNYLSYCPGGDTSLCQWKETKVAICVNEKEESRPGKCNASTKPNCGTLPTPTPDTYKRECIEETTTTNSYCGGTFLTPPKCVGDIPNPGGDPSSNASYHGGCKSSISNSESGCLSNCRVRRKASLGGGSSSTMREQGICVDMGPDSDFEEQKACTWYPGGEWSCNSKTNKTTCENQAGCFWVPSNTITTRVPVCKDKNGITVSRDKCDFNTRPLCFTNNPGSNIDKGSCKVNPSVISYGGNHYENLCKEISNREKCPSMYGISSSSNGYYMCRMINPETQQFDGKCYVNDALNNDPQRRKIVPSLCKRLTESGGEIISTSP